MTEQNTQTTQQTPDFSSIGKIWEKGDFHRLYLTPEKVAKLVGLELGFYKTGNICYSAIDGEKISHARAGRMLSSWEGAFIDLVTGELHKNRSREDVAFDDEILEAYKAIAENKENDQ